MSRTDKTRPLWVQVADERMVTCVPVHDHRFGPCTLPNEITVDSTSVNRRSSGCHWTGNYHYLFNLSNGCRSCTDYYFRREDRRRSRHEARRELRAYRGED